jgi:hypothetical protein
MALDLMAIHTALVNQIVAGVERGVNPYPVRPETPKPPYVTLEPDARQYVANHGSFRSETVGALCDMQADIVVGQTGRPEDAQAFLLGVLSSGTGMGMSVLDAVEADRTLGDVIDTCICLFSGGPVQQEDGSWEVRIPILITLRRT